MPKLYEAGRELDAIISMKVFGIEPFEHSVTTLRGEKMYVNLPAYSTEIAAAWKVVEKFTGIDTQAGKFGEVELLKSDDYWQVRFEGQQEFIGADTAPLAICLAALEILED